MGIFERIAEAIFRMARGDVKKRWLFTPVVGFIFACFVALFFLAAVFTDRWLQLPSISYMPWTLIPALILLVAGSILLVWTWTLFIIAHGTAVPVNPPHQLITTGLYKYSRNPMMLGIYLVFFGVGIWIGSLSLVAIYTPLFIIIMTVYAKKIEEKELELKFGQPYVDYKKRVRMYI